MVVLEAVQAMRVVKEDIRIEDEILRQAPGLGIYVFGELGKENPLFLIGLENSGSEHQKRVARWKTFTQERKPEARELKSERLLKTGRCVILSAGHGKHKLCSLLSPTTIGGASIGKLTRC